jgi:DNA-binding NarL/FixJ family response regulator
MEKSSSEKPRRPIGVYLGVENRLLREALISLCQKESGISVVGQNQSCEATAERIGNADSDVLLLNSLSATSIVNLIGDLALCHPHIKIILFGMEEDPECFLRFVRLGISGYLLKEATSSEIISAVRSVFRGEAVCPPRLCMTLFGHIAREFRHRSGMADDDACLLFGLTFRQRQLVSLIAKGMTNKEIASNLNLSEYTVKNHVYRIMKQVEAESRQEAVDLIRSGGYLADSKRSA